MKLSTPIDIPRVVRAGVLALTVAAGLSGCAHQPRSLSLNELESPKYQLTERRRLPIDFAGIQQNLFRHAQACGETYQFEMVPNESSYAHVVYRLEPDAGWDRSVILSLVLLHNRTVNVRAYSYYAGQLDRALTMLTAMMMPDTCGIDHSWENRLDDGSPDDL